MQDKALRGLIGTCIAVALIPFVPWLIAMIFDSVDDRWLDSLPGLSISIPIALAMAALVFAGHGLALHVELAADLDEGLAVLLTAQPREAGVTSGTPSMASAGVSRGFGATPPALAPIAAPEVPSTAETDTEPSGKDSSVAVDPRASKGDKDSKIPKVAKGAKRKIARRAKARARYAFRAQMNKSFNRL
jgi:hypothetical protein